MEPATRLNVLQRQVGWNTHYCLSLIEDLEYAADQNDAGSSCEYARALVAGTFTLSHSLWPGGRRITDRLAVEHAAALRASFGLDDESPLNWLNLAPLGHILGPGGHDCAETFDQATLSVYIDGEQHSLRPLIAAVRALWPKVTSQVERLPHRTTSGNEA